ncbi:hypothetical protein BS17DRAFT_115342 [Gyrodon lividus]|nr:hypothetical protein BS17DRAFT_115342 [Gyrodon lividus]
MFKRVERKRKKHEEEDMKEIMGLQDTDSDESNSESESGDWEHSDQDGVDANIGSEEDKEAREMDDEMTSEEEDIDEEPPMSVAEALKNPIYLISLDPTVHACILCKGKLIKSEGMAVAHRNAIAHKRRFERFKVLAIKVDQGNDAWDIAKAVQSAKAHHPEPEISSNRALKRQAKQVAIREKRKRHQELKAKAIAKKARQKSSKGDEIDGGLAPLTKPLNLPALQGRSEKSRKKRKIERKASTKKLVETQEFSQRSPSQGHQET